MKKMVYFFYHKSLVYASNPRTLGILVEYQWDAMFWVVRSDHEPSGLPLPTAE